MTQLSDELLLAYLDGQLAKEQALGIGELAAANPEVSRRLLRLKKTQSHLIETFMAIREDERAVPFDMQFAEPEAAPRPPPPSPGPAPAPAKNAARAQAAAVSQDAAPRRKGAGGVALIALLAGMGAGYLGHAWFAPPIMVEPKLADRAAPAPQPPAWSVDLARFHAFFPRETLTPHPDAITNPELIGFQLAKVTGRPVAPPDFSRQGYSLVRGQTFKYGQDRVMQLTYAAAQEPPLVLYALPGGEEQAVKPGAHEGFQTVSFGASKLRFMLAAQKSNDDLTVLASVAQSQLLKKAQ
jgi:anti-sigma factor RsiW